MHGIRKRAAKQVGTHNTPAELAGDAREVEWRANGILCSTTARDEIDRMLLGQLDGLARPERKLQAEIADRLLAAELIS